MTKEEAIELLSRGAVLQFWQSDNRAFFIDGDKAPECELGTVYWLQRTGKIKKHKSPSRQFTVWKSKPLFESPEQEFNSHEF